MNHVVRFALFASFVCVVFCSNSFGQSTNFVNFEGKQTRPIRLSPDGKRLFAVNTPDSRLSVFDVSNPGNPILIAEIPVGLEPVSVNPLNSDEAWVVNEVSDSISVVSVSRHIVTDTIYVKDEPVDVVFAKGKAFVAAARKNQIRVFDITNHSDLATISVLGENPRAMALNPAATKLYAVFALSGNRTTLLPFDKAPSQGPNGAGSTNPAPPKVSRIVDAEVAFATNGIAYHVGDKDIAEIDTSSLSVTRYFTNVGTVNFACAISPANGDLYVANTDARNTVRFEPNVRGAFVTNQISRVNLSSGVVTRYDLNPAVETNLMPSLTIRSNALAQPTAVEFNPGGDHMWVTAFGSDRVARVHPNGTVLSRIEVGPTIGSDADARNKRGPRGLAVSGAKVYVLNRIANTITVIDAVSETVERELPVGSFDPTPVVIRQGRGFLYDARLSGAGMVSCASCHIDAEMDMIAWDLGDPNGTMAANRVTINPESALSAPSSFHPMKGPMVTQTLRGLLGLEPLHWRGDRTNFLHFNGAFASLLGGTVLPAQDMQAYRDFIETIVFQPNPNQNLDRSLPTTFPNGGNPSTGRNTFLNVQYQPSVGLACNTCHTVPTGTARAIIAAQALQEPQDVKVPHLRNVYQKLNLTHAAGATSVGGFGIVHDGQDPDLFTFLSRPVFGIFATNTVIKRDIEAFVQCFDTGTAPAVGYGRTIAPSNVDSGSISNDWNLLETEARKLTNINLIAKGTVDGKLRGLLYDPTANNYRADKTGVGPFTRAQLRSKILAGDTLTFTGVPPGSGYRLGIDRNQDGVLDGDAPQPSLGIALAGSSAIVAWPTNANGFLLERASVLPAPAWSPDTNLRGINGSKFNVTNSVAETNALFFRLREL